MSLPESDPFLKRKMIFPVLLQRTLLYLMVTGVVLTMVLPESRFPWWYHNDEPSKVHQIVSGERNLRHPPLMLSLTETLVSLSGAEKDSQVIVEWGRFISALAVGLALALMVDWTFVMVHPLAAFCLAVVLPFHSGLFEVAHYFKEDALFLLGIALGLRALAFWMRQPGTFSSICLGLSLAVLSGSKYVGWLLIVLILIRVFTFPKVSRGIKARLAGFFVAGVLLIYGPALVRLEILKLFLGKEVSLLFSGDYGAGLAVPHAVYWQRLCDDFSMPLIVAGVAAYVIGAYRRRLPGYRLMPAACLVAMCCLAWTSKYSDRYLLPVQFLGMVLVVSGPVLMALSFFQEKAQRQSYQTVLFLAAGLPALVLLHWNLPDFQKRSADFHRDSRKELVQWMRTHLDPDKVMIGEDDFAKIKDPGFSPRIWSASFVADLGSPEELISYGVTHVIISYDVYHRFVDGSVVAGEGEKDLFQRRQHFYRQVLEKGKILWSGPCIDPKALHPGLTLIELE